MGTVYKKTVPLSDEERAEAVRRLLGGRMRCQTNQNGLARSAGGGRSPFGPTLIG